MDRFIANGVMVTISPEDECLLEERTWRIWAASERQRRIVVCDVMAEGSRYRFHLHREVAFRMDPANAKMADRLTVSPANGNFLDVRRENLEITIRPRKRGNVRSARGHAVKPFRGRKPSAKPPAWSRAGRRAAAEHGD